MPASRSTPALAAAAGLLLATAGAADSPWRGRIGVAPPGGEVVGLYVEETGVGPPLVLLHGLGASTFTWRKLVPTLATNHRVINVDMKGFGRSDKPLDDNYSGDEQARLIAALIEKRGLSGVTLMGHSFGGAVVLKTATLPAMRGRIDRVVVISSPAQAGSIATELEALRIPLIPDAITAALPPETLARILLQGSRPGPIPEADIKGYAAPYYDFSAKRAFVSSAKTLLGQTDDDLSRNYRAIDVPVLAVWCRDDPVVPLASGRRLVRTLPNARLVILERCQHLPQDVRPQRLLAVLQPFLSP